MNKSKKPKRVQKPFIRGAMIDSATGKSAIRFFCGIVMMCALHLMLACVTVFEWAGLRQTLAVLTLFGTWTVNYRAGCGRGAQDTALGENYYVRLNAKDALDKEKRKGCYHPAKGFFQSFLAVLPLLLMAIWFACITRRQYHSLGTLPDWVKNMQQTGEIGHALDYYAADAAIRAEDVLRMVMRILLMPWVVLIGTEQADALLWLQRLGPMLLMLYPAFYSIGYLSGPGRRALIHGAIQENNSKREMREKRQIARNRERNQKNELN